MKNIEKKDTDEFIDNGVFKKKLHGYIFIKIGTKFVPEHRLVVEQFIKRLLKPNEVIHHINGDKMDNRIENLMLFKDQKAHAHFHRQLLQHGLTNPRMMEINNLKINMLKEREKNIMKENI